MKRVALGAVNRITLIGREVAQAQQKKIVDRLEENNIIFIKNSKKNAENKSSRQNTDN